MELTMYCQDCEPLPPEVMRRKEKEKIQQITAFSNTAIGQTFWFLYYSSREISNKTRQHRVQTSRLGQICTSLIYKLLGKTSLPVNSYFFSSFLHYIHVPIRQMRHRQADSELVCLDTLAGEKIDKYTTVRTHFIRNKPAERQKSCTRKQNIQTSVFKITIYKSKEGQKCETQNTLQ